MATYQELKDSLTGKLSTTNDPELEEMVTTLITYTDVLLTNWPTGTPPALPNPTAGSRSLPPASIADADGDEKTEPTLPNPTSGSKIV
jgi:hypothetical protein